MNLLVQIRQATVGMLFLLLIILLAPAVNAQSLSADKFQQFEEAVIRGEEFLKAKEYAKAKAEYQEALQIDPTSKFSQDKLTLIRKFYIDPEDETRFIQFMASGNKLFDSKKYNEAHDAFAQAANIKPEDKPAREKMAESEKLAQVMANKQKQYDKFITDADKLMSAGDAEAARAAYVSATEVFPDNPYPQQKIATIDAQSAALNAQKEAYDQALTDGDEAYMNRDFVTAKLKYEQALKMKPGESYPKSMLERVTEGSAQLVNAQQNYAGAIASADKLFAAKDFETALSAYQNAQKILPGEKYPAQQIEKINAVFAEKQQLDANYEKTIKNADQLFSEEKYSDAKSQFQHANDLKPDEAYPKQKIEEIARILLALKDAEREKAYNEAVSRADELLVSKEYDKALSAFSEARSINPEENYPAEKISEINQLLAREKSAQEGYLQHVERADRLFTENKYREAKNEYAEALNIKPSEDYPNTQIKKIDELLDEIQKKETQFNALIARADDELSKKNYPQAMTSYQQALKLKPDDDYATEKVTEIQSLLNQLQSNEEQYARLIAEGDKSYGNKQWDDASTNYQQAVGLKPGEQYPKDKIAAITKLKEEQRISRENYEQKIATADQLFEARDYEKATKNYKEAASILPDETYPAGQISRIMQIVEELKSLEDNFDKYVKAGDASFGQKQWDEAKKSFNQALELKPEENYPKEKLSLIEKEIASEAVLQLQFDVLIASADELFKSDAWTAATDKYAEALKLKPAELYPQLQIQKIENLLTNQAQNEAAYTKARDEGDRLYNVKNLEVAADKYDEALQYKPGDEYITSRIAEIKTTLGKQQEISQQYEQTIQLGDEKLSSNLYDEAETAYNQALLLKPTESYPKQQLSVISEKRSAAQTAEQNFSKWKSEGDRLFAANEYETARESYLKALGIKTNDSYLTGKISEIEGLLEERKQLADKDYLEAIDKADEAYRQQDYNSAIKFYETASAQKPAESYPKERILTSRNILLERTRNQMEAYNKLINNADQLYQQKVYDQAIDAYIEAGKSKADEVYPGIMIDKIRKYLDDHAMVNLVTSAIEVEADTEERFTFTPIEMRLRKNNYIAIKARKTSESEPKVYINYGKGGQKNGGIVLRSITRDETGDFLVRVSIQDRWYREDNNWIAIYAEGGSIEVSRMQIAQGD